MISELSHSHVGAVQMQQVERARSTAEN